MRETLVKTEEFKDSPVGRIPKDWEIKTLGELGNFQNGLNKGKKDFGFGTKFVNILDVYPQRLNVSVLGRMNASQSEISSYQLEVGDILLDRSSVKLDGVGYPTVFERADEPVIFCGFIIRFRLSAPAIKPRFLCELMRDEFFRNRIFQIATRSANVNVNQEQLAKLWVAFPPAPEQEQIIAILNTIDSTIAHTSSLIAKLKQMKAGLLHDLLTRGLDENGELRDAIGHPEQFKDSPLGRIPKDWNVQLVGEVFDLQLGKMLSKASKIGHSPFPYLANRNVQWDEVVLSDLEWMDFNDNEREKFSLLPGDLLVCEGGESGRTALWKGEMDNCYFQKAIHRLRPKDSQVLPDYMLRFMRRAFEHGFLTSFTSQTSITHLTREKFALLPLPLPKVEEQKAIVNVLDSFDTRIRKEEAYRDKLKLQKQGLMHDLLTGKVRVKDADKFTPASDKV